MGSLDSGLAGPHGYQAMKHAADDHSSAPMQMNADHIAHGFDFRSPKVSKILGLHQVVRLRQMLLQWRRRAANNIDRTLQVMSPHGRKLLLRGSSSCGRSTSTSSSSSSLCEGNGCSGEAHHEQLPPVGFLAIYVGRERRRFEIRAEHINHPLLRGLLERTEEEFGLNQRGGLAIPACEVVLFEHLLWMVENEDMEYLFEDPTELRELLDFYMHAGGAGSSTPTSNCLQEANLNKVTASVSAC
ncbi:hypothetical protein GOP47_0028791 [Adiantum capillus-veneris]|nr:hypothetical protein GOP47_0028791 [Adiantum capillus-veneris]